MAQIEQFYAGKTIFITGGTGFLGKILIEKLLRSCPEIETVYVLVRPKKGKNIEERINSLLVEPIFELLRNDYPDFSQKIVGVEGNAAEEGLGLSTTDYALLISQVSVIFHLAATIRFNETLETAVAINVNSTKYVVELAKACKNLQAAIYVSTAYSNCTRNTIEEKLYPPPLTYERVNQVVKDLGKQKLSEDEMNSSTKKIIGDWPNTYSFTKAIAEGVVVEFAKDLPFAIFRPSIVINAYNEPIPGWVNGPLGFPGVVCAFGVGIARVGVVDINAKTDLVPVDYVCNALISCAWETAITERPHHEDIPVYNYVSGNQNPITWDNFFRTSEKYAHLFPAISTIYYPFGMPVKSASLFIVLHYIAHLIPAIIIDNVARLFGKELGLYKFARKFENSFWPLMYFTLREWEFKDDRTQSLGKRIGPRDRAIFPFSIRNLDWEEYFFRMVRGDRKYILHELEENLQQARRRFSYLYIVHVMVCLTLGIFVLSIVWKFFCGSSLTTSVVHFLSWMDSIF